MFELIGCAKCGHNKGRMTHSYGTYKVYKHDNIIRIRCKTCGYIVRFKIIDGGVMSGEDD